MNPLKKLMGETVIYGFTTIIGRFVNWLLVPLYVRVFATDEYGVVISTLAYTALLLVLLTYGTETGFFRFAGQDNKNKVFTTLFSSLFFTSSLFLILCFVFAYPIANFIEIPDYPIYVILLAVTLVFDILSTLPFALLRQEGRAVRFGVIKIVNICINIGSNLFFLLLCPYLEKQGFYIPFYDPNGGVIYIFISYLIASVVTFMMLVPTFKNFKFQFDFKMLGEIMKYSYPILIVSVAGMINLQADKILMPKLLDVDSETAKSITGIYGANYKLAFIMYIFTQGFKYAFEPFFFNYAKHNESKKIYADILIYFTGFGLMIFLGVMFYLDLLKHFISPDYYVGLIIIPWVLMANLFQGIYYSLSLWYKLSDKTIYGAVMAVVGSAITLAGNFIFLPRIGFMASAYTVFTCFLLMTIMSLILGNHFYKVDYDIKKLVIYFIICLLIYYVGEQIVFTNDLLTCVARTPLLLLFMYIFIRREMSFALTKQFWLHLFSKK